MASNGDLRDLVYNCEPKLTLGPGESHVCSFCKKCFPNLQSLGGHQTVHRQEIKQMRDQHEKYMGERRKRAKVESKRGRRAAAPVAAGEPRRVHGSHAKEKRVLVEIDFVGKFDSVDRRSSEGPVSDPAIERPKEVEEGEEVTSSEKLNLELSL